MAFDITYSVAATCNLLHPPFFELTHHLSQRGLQFPDERGKRLTKEYRYPVSAIKPSNHGQGNFQASSGIEACREVRAFELGIKRGSGGLLAVIDHWERRHPWGVFLYDINTIE